MRNNKERPRIKVRKTWFDYLLEAGSLLSVLVGITFLVVYTETIYYIWQCLELTDLTNEKSGIQLLLKPYQLI